MYKKSVVVFLFLCLCETVFNRGAVDDNKIISARTIESRRLIAVCKKNAFVQPTEWLSTKSKGREP